MLVARNQHFRIAAALSAFSFLLLAVGGIVEANHLFHEVVRSGYDAAQVLFVAVHLVGAAGWTMIAIAFGEEIDWDLLRSGATIVAVTYGVYFVAWMFRLVAVFADVHSGDYRGYYVAGAIEAILLGVAAAVTATAFRAGRQGGSRASRLQLGFGLFVAATLAGTGAELFLQSFYSAERAVSEAKIGSLVVAAGTFVTAAAAVIFAGGVRGTLIARERSLAAAAAVAVLATFCIAAGEAVIAYAYSSRGGEGWEQAVAWLAVAGRLALVAAFVAVALGARSVSDDSGLGDAGAA
jgi:hypothetical protein